MRTAESLKGEGLRTSVDMLDFILKSNAYEPLPYTEDTDVKIGYGHRVAKTRLLTQKAWSEEESWRSLIKDLKEAEALVQNVEDPLLFDISVHFIFDHGHAPYRNCRFPKLMPLKDYEKIKAVYKQALEYYKHTPYYEKRLHDFLVLKGEANGNKERVVKKDVRFGCRA